MRTTLTLEDDVAARLELLRRSEDKPLKQVVNAVLRAGLDAMGRSSEPGGPYRTSSVSLGGSLVGDIANVQEVLSLVEGESRR